MILGARIIKTGLAITLALFICKTIKVEPATFAAITAAINMQPSVGKALKNAWEQIGIHILAVILAIIIGLLLGTGPLVIGFASIIMIMISNQINWSKTLNLGVVSIIFILDSPPDTFLTHAGIRSLAIFIGLGVALLINRVLAPPKYKLKLQEELHHLFQETSIYFLGSLNTFIHSHSMSSYELREPKELKTKLEKVLWLYEHSREELTNEDNPLFIERLLEISRGFIERGQSISEMTRQRVNRRHSPDSPLPTEKVSLEFENVLKVLSTGENKIAQLVRDLVNGIREGTTYGPFEEDLEYWIEFNQAIDEWHTKVSGVFYLRALMEVAVVATEMRLADRRLKSLHNLRKKQAKEILAGAKS
ncbi:MAG: aromatic acid exporter family protein [Desulfitobacterium hafniense]|nr:aromatic acid exporter family protein [Desulfitobacterium hafniense]